MEPTAVTTEFGESWLKTSPFAFSVMILLKSDEATMSTKDPEMMALDQLLPASFEVVKPPVDPISANFSPSDEIAQKLGGVVPNPES